MSNLAEQIVVPIRPDMQVMEHCVADIEDCYTRIANEILETSRGENQDS